MRTRISRWWSSFGKRLQELYLVAFAITFIGIGAILLLLPMFKSTVWQAISGAFLVSGFSILVTTITARQSSLEGYKKDANLNRKTDVYGPLHSELKRLRERFDTTRVGREPYPRWIDIPDVERPSSLQFAPIDAFYTFALWPNFKKDYRVDNFTPAAQQCLNEVQQFAVAYDNAVKEAQKSMQKLLRPHIAQGIEDTAKLQAYQLWKPKRNENSNRWFEFIDDQMRTPSYSTEPLGYYLAITWSRTIGWILIDKPDQAAQAIYEHEAINWDAGKHVKFDWFKDIFQVTWSELRGTPEYQQVQDIQEKLYTKLREAENILYQGLIYIRDRYEGGKPPV